MNNPSFCAGVGLKKTNSFSGVDYQTVDWATIVAETKEPTQWCDKNDGSWFMASSYHAFDARRAIKPEQNREYPALWADVDSGNPTFSQVKAFLVSTFGSTTEAVVYSTRSTGELSDDGTIKQKWRLAVLLDKPVNYEQFKFLQKAMNNELLKHGIVPDRTVENATRIVFRPNKNPNPPAGYEYQGYHQSGQPFSPSGTLLEAEATRLWHLQAKIDAEAAEVKKTGAGGNVTRSYIEEFREEWPSDVALVHMGFETIDGINWRHPSQTSEAYGTFLRPDGSIFTPSDTLAAAGGQEAPNGGRNFSDALELMAWHYAELNEQGWREASAIEASKAQMIQYYKDKANAGWSEHGREVYNSLKFVGGVVGPAGVDEVLAESAASAALIEQTVDVADDAEAQNWNIDWPPGVVGEIAKHFYNAASRPVKQYSISMAIFMMASMLGRQYNVEQQGLNLYMAFVGNSGCGKGEVRRLCKRLYGEIAKRTQDLDNITYVFDNKFPASDSGLRRMFVNQPTLPRSIFKEDGDALMAQLTESHPGSLGDKLRSEFSEFWDQSGEGLRMGAVQYSKNEDSTESIESPSLTLGFDMQIDPFNSYLGSKVVISTGIGARFLYTVRPGTKRMKKQKNRNMEVPEALLRHLTATWTSVRMAQQVKHVQWEPEAFKAYEKLDDDITVQINAGKEGTDILNRLHMNAARVAGVLAASNNPTNPLITEQLFDWATVYMRRGYQDCLEVLYSGEAGQGESVRVSKAIKAIQDYVVMKPGKRATYKVPRVLDSYNDIICENYMVSKLFKLHDFKGSDTGYTSQDLVRRTVEELVKQEYLVPMSRADLASQRNIVLDLRTRQNVYAIGPSFN